MNDDGEELETYFTSISTIREAWEKSKTLLDDLALAPRGDLYSIHNFVDCSSEELNSKKEGLVLLGSFNQVLGVSFNVEKFNGETLSIFLQGIYLPDSDISYISRSLEAWDDQTSSIKEISLEAVLYNDNLGVMGVLDIEFKTESQGYLEKDLSFKSFYPFTIFKNHQADYRDYLLFLLVISWGVMDVFQTIKLTMVFFFEKAATSSFLLIIDSIESSLDDSEHNHHENLLS